MKLVEHDDLVVDLKTAIQEPQQVQLMHGDCLELMKSIPDGSIDLILTDPPYGTSACKWDTVIPFEPMWEQLKRIIKPNGAIVLFGSEPFSSLLRCSNLKMFKYDWVWEKSKGSNFVHAKYQPLKTHENILIFSKVGSAQGSKTPMTYNPQMVDGAPYDKGFGHNKLETLSSGLSKSTSIHLKNDSGLRYPRSVQYFKTAEMEGKFHPTQKPVALLEYLIKTYTQEGETVLDFTAGSMSTAIACINTNRKGIMIEKDDHYFRVGSDRVDQALRDRANNNI